MANRLQLKRGTGAPGNIFYEGEPIFDKSGKTLYVGVEGTGSGTGVAIASSDTYLASLEMLYRASSSGAGQLRLYEDTDNGTNYVAIAASAALGSNYTLRLPDTAGSDGQVLRTDGNGNLTWVNQTSGFSGFTISDGSNTSSITDSNTVTFTSGEGIDAVVTQNGDTVTISAEAASATNAGIASYQASQFYFEDTYKVGVVTATTSTKGLASFDSNYFTVTDGAVSFSTGTLTGTISTATRATTVDTVSTGDNPANYYITFVNSNNGSSTAETVYTDDGIYYNPGTNTFTTQHALFTGNVTVAGTLTGTATTATRATTVDTTAASDNVTYYVPFVDTVGGQSGETLKVSGAISLNASTGNVGVASILSVGSISEVNAFIKAGGGSNALYLYSNGDVSFQAKAIVNQIRSSNNASTLITLNDLDATFARSVSIGSTLTVGTGVGITQFSSSVSTGSSATSVPTSSAVIDYVGSQVGAIDLTVTTAEGTNGTGGGGGSFNTSQTLTFAGTSNEIDVTVSGQTVTYGLPNNVSITNDLYVGGNLRVVGTAVTFETQVVKVEDRIIELGLVDGTTDNSTTWDLGVAFNYGDGTTAQKSGIFWLDNTIIGIASALVLPITNDTGTSDSTPEVTIASYAPVAMGSLYIGGTSDATHLVINSAREAKNLIFDGGSY